MTRYKVRPSKSYRQGRELMRRRGADLQLLDEVIALLADGKQLPTKYKNHPMIGKWSGCYDCHILRDWVLIYEYIRDELVLGLLRTGTHDDLKIEKHHKH